MSDEGKKERKWKGGRKDEQSREGKERVKGKLKDETMAGKNVKRTAHSERRDRGRDGSCEGRKS